MFRTFPSREKYGKFWYFCTPKNFYQMKKSLIALSFGTLGLGIAEFVMMGILPEVAQALGVSIPTAGHFISAYALGVCCGAPMLIMLRRRPMKQVLLFLVSLMMFGNLCAAIAPSYWMMLPARFISGLPHGAYFGVASIVASKLATKGKESEAVAIMIAGMTVANLFGVPLGTLLSTYLSWRLVFCLVVLWGAFTLWAIRRWVPYVAPLPDTGFRGQFRFLKHGAPWLLLGATMMGNGGAFCWYSYVSPMLTTVSGFKPEAITGLMILAGGGMVLGNLCGGRLSVYLTPGRVAALMQGVMAAALLCLFFLSPYRWVAVVLMCTVTFCLFGVSSPQQFLLIKFAPGGEMLGAASVQMAFNLGNAVGAYCGGLPVEAGWDYRYPALIGVFFALAGFGLLVGFYRKYEKKARVKP